MLTDTPSSQLDLEGSRGGDPPATLTAEMAWCLERFLTGRADEPTMRRAEEALAAWDAWLEKATIDLAST